MSQKVGEKILYVASVKLALPSIAPKLKKLPYDCTTEIFVPYLALPSIPLTCTVSLAVNVA